MLLLSRPSAEKFMANKHTRKRPKVLGCTKPDGGKNQHKYKVNLASVNKYAGKKAKKAAALARALMRGQVPTHI